MNRCIQLVPIFIGKTRTYSAPDESGQVVRGSPCRLITDREVYSIRGWCSLISSIFPFNLLHRFCLPCVRVGKLFCWFWSCVGILSDQPMCLTTKRWLIFIYKTFFIIFSTEHGIKQANVFAFVSVDSDIFQTCIFVAFELVNGIIHQS